MNFSNFPFDTNEAKAEVTLPIGAHVFRLVVTDDTGSVSLPDTVTIMVKRKADEPRIIAVEPPEGQRGQRLEAVLTGANLHEITAIQVFRNDQVDERITVTLRDGATATQAPILIHILDHATLGNCALVVTTTHGTATIAFTVISAEAPRIIDITPTWGSLGLPYNVAARIEGDHLERAQAVRFLLDGRQDETLRAKIHQTTKEFVDLDLVISAEAVLGNRTFTVTTPNGAADSPPGVNFQVGPGPVQIGVITLTLITALIHLALNFPDPLFILNGLGYLALLYFYYWPTPVLWGQRTVLRWLYVGYAAVTIIAWLALATPYDLLGFVTKAIELALIGLLLLEYDQARRKVILSPGP